MLALSHEGLRSLRGRRQVGVMALGAAFSGVLAGDRQPQAIAARQRRVAALVLQAMLDAAGLRERRRGGQPGLARAGTAARLRAAHAKISCGGKASERATTTRRTLTRTCTPTLSSRVRMLPGVARSSSVPERPDGA